MSKEKSKKNSDLVKNRRAFYDYHIDETFEAGISLLGSEVKSLREGGGSLTDAYVKLVQGEAFLVGASIAPYSHVGAFGHQERRDRKLLLHKRELAKLDKAAREKGLTIIPLALYLVRGRVKAKVGIGRGKKSFDKRSSIKEREAKRDIERQLKR